VEMVELIAKLLVSLIDAAVVVLVAGVCVLAAL